MFAHSISSSICSFNEAVVAAKQVSNPAVRISLVDELMPRKMLKGSENGDFVDILSTSVAEATTADEELQSRFVGPLDDSFASGFHFFN